MKASSRNFRKQRIRKKIMGTSERPRLCVYRSLKNISVQIIDDLERKTLVSCSTQEKALQGQFKSGGNVEAAKKIGQMVAERATQKNVKTVVFDRSGYAFHGRIKAVAEAAREAGLKF